MAPPSVYSGSPWDWNALARLRSMNGSDKPQPSPNGPLPAPVSYWSSSCGAKPPGPAGSSIGTL
jgi:hypothetical protein